MKASRDGLRKIENKDRLGCRLSLRQEPRLCGYLMHVEKNRMNVEKNRLMKYRSTTVNVHGFCLGDP